MNRIASTALAAVLLLLPVAVRADEGMMTGNIRAETPVTGGGAASTVEVGETFRKNPTAVITTTVLPPTIRKVSVLVESNPANADIEVDGVYVGTTPVQVTLKEGVHFVRVSREGFLAWEKSVKAYNGLTVSPTLVQESIQKKDSTRSAQTK
ncbi:MAG: PEGA domain-containing protein [Nitrospinae bacterium]|nr:PEGA domain-containing protein [Nitrospinota bacterium]